MNDLIQLFNKIEAVIDAIGDFIGAEAESLDLDEFSELNGHLATLWAHHDMLQSFAKNECLIRAIKSAEVTLSDYREKFDD